jgi:uncharacterized protein (TIGR02594 family)
MTGTTWPRWAETAFRELLLDVKEIPGTEHSARVLEYHAVTGLGASNDETPWCASFVGACLKWSAFRYTGSALARSYEGWGEPESAESPRHGAIVVLSRGQSPTLGHVGFYVGRYGPAIHVLGGNQGNRVSVRPYSEDRIVGFRWPGAADEVR